MRTKIVAVLTTSVALILSSCGGGSQDASSTSSTPPSTTPSTAPDPTTRPTQPTNTPSVSPPLNPRYETQLDQSPQTAVISGNQAGAVDYAATTTYINGVIKHVDTVWSNWFKEIGYPEPWVGYQVVQPGAIYQSNCNIAGQTVFGSDYPNAFYCDKDMNSNDVGMLVLPVETMSKMWNGDIFTRKVDNLKVVGDFAAGVIVAHEFGHHIQAELTEVTGIPGPTNPNVELIADCFAGIWTYAVNIDSLLEAGDIDEALNALEVIGDNKGSHGTGAERDNAFQIGVSGSKADSRGGVPQNCMAAFWPGFLR